MHTSESIFIWFSTCGRICISAKRVMNGPQIQWKRTVHLCIIYDGQHV